MMCFFWLFRRRKTRQASRGWEREQPAVTTPESEPRIYLDAPYLLPKDKQEDDRLRFQHYALYAAFGTHYLAPVRPDIRTILDVGSGTGSWVADMAHQFPQAHVLGVDLTFTSLPDPLPSTGVFAYADILQGLPFPACQFDFTHQRLLVGAIPAIRWPDVVQELVRVTRLQGWIELLEVGATILHAGAATERLLAWVRETSQARDMDLTLVAHLGDLLERAGCQTVETHDIPIPLGGWAGRSGEMLKLDAIRVFQAMRPRTATSVEQLERMVAEAADEWERHRAAYVFHVAYGRRVSL